MEVPKAKVRVNLTLKQETVYKIFSSIIGKQEIGKVTATQVEQIMTIAEQATERVLAVKG